MPTQVAPVIIPARITESFVIAHPEYIFLYGYDVASKGALGQCVVCVGHKNCFPIPTCWKMCKSSGYFQDSQYKEICNQINLALLSIPQQNNPIIIPFPKIGCGASRMKEFAPKAFAYLQERLSKIQYPNIQRKY